jgi:hypothetical protein
VNELRLDPTIYPRTTQSRQTIDAYAEALAIGAQFPPIKIQRVFNYGDGQTATILRLSRLGWTQEKFKDLGWGLRTWDQWYFNECDDRFGDDWPVTKKPGTIGRTLLIARRT